MRTHVSSAVVFALVTVSCTVGLLAQSSTTTTKPAQDKVDVVGCIAQVDVSSTPTATPGVLPSRTFLLTKVKPGTTATPATTTPSVAASKSKSAAVIQYRLSGSDSMVGPYASHQVEITGTIQPAEGKSGGSAANAPTLTVESVRLVAPSCP